MPRGHYVIAQEQTGIYRIRLLVGPFATHRAAAMMVRPVERTGRYRGCTIRAHTHIISKGKTLPPGAFDLSLIDVADVIEASRVIDNVS